MKKIVLSILILTFTFSNAQEIKQIPSVNVSGVGKIKVIPDQVSISVSIETKGSNAIDVKKENDSKMDLILKFIKKMNIANDNFQTQRVTLTPNYDYEKKKHNYIANQSVIILLKNLDLYDEFLKGLVDSGVNRIDNVEFQTSKLNQLQSEARKLAIIDAKVKAEDFVAPLGQNIGSAISITDNSAAFVPRPMFFSSKMEKSIEATQTSNETLAPGQIEVEVNVNASFILEIKE